MKQKFYVVWRGKTPGIYTSWAECEAEIKGVQGAQYKSYKTKPEAERAFSMPYNSAINHTKTLTNTELDALTPSPILNSLSVDAACSGNPGILEYQGVYTKTGTLYFKKEPIPKGTNNLGEFLAIVHALALQHKTKESLPIYSDSKTAIAWVRNKAIKSNLPQEEETQEIWELIQRALTWLKTHTYPNKILKWDTENWGEIRADFNRK